MIKNRSVRFRTIDSVLTIYEQIQGSIDFAEANLADGASSEAAADAGCMSVRSLHRYFPALTGYRFGEYVRKRRLSEASDTLRSSDDSVLRIAIESGYDSHEAFTRAFKKEFGVAPARFRAERLTVGRTNRIDLVGEVIMGVLMKSLPEMTAVCFDGFRPEPEQQAHEQMATWMDLHPESVASCRIFGHNIDRAGNLSQNPVNDGYRLMVTIPAGAPPLEPETHLTTIDSGEFVVTGIEGSFDDDPTGTWITEGWKRLQVMIERQGLVVHPSNRWYEEALEPTAPGRARFDLYLEIEE